MNLVDGRRPLRRGPSAMPHATLDLRPWAPALRATTIDLVRIDRYEFGLLIVDGRKVRSDVLVTSAGMQEGWWRREGHVLHLEDLHSVLDEHVKRLVVGTGASGRMQLAAGLESDLVARGIVVEVLPTTAAVKRINDLLRTGASDWAGALHLTC